MSQSTVENVVAGSGTALTVNQVRKLHRFTNNITLIYDGDDAGVNAALRNSDLIHGEGMNVSVLFLPDGQDPDDFAKSHTPEELQEFIANNSTDSIIFRINRTLDGVTDPIKRSQAINAIVDSIAIIKDPILRDTYIRECAQRTGVPETTLIGQMNRAIRRSMDDRQKQQAREQRQESQSIQTGTATPQPQQADVPAASGAQPSSPNSQQSTPNSQPSPNSTFNTPHSTFNKVESMLIEAVIRHGNEIIFRDVQNEATGEKVNLTVAQYVAYDLGLDNLSFTAPIYNTILQEAVEHSADPSWVSLTYFTHHPDINISTIASQMGADKFQLSESLQVKTSEESLRSSVMHIILDFRLDYVKRHLKDLRTELLSTKDSSRMMEIMAEIKKMQEVRNILAQKLGSDIVV